MVFCSPSMDGLSHPYNTVVYSSLPGVPTKIRLDQLAAPLIVHPDQCASWNTLTIAYVQVPTVIPTSPAAPEYGIAVSW